MDFLPLFCQLQNKPVLIVGGGEVAVRKARLLLDAKAKITINAPHLEPQLMSWAEQGRLTVCAAGFHPELLDGKWLVIAATNQPEVNQQVFHEANLRQIFCNVVDSPAHCSAIMPAIIDRSPLMVAISSAGAAQAGKLRERVKLIPDKLARRRFWERLFSHERLARQLARGQQQAAEQSVAELLDEPLQSKGSVTLVGAGPGDAGLLTLSGLQQLQQADVVVYDRLVSQAVLALVRRDAERIFVGKEAGRHCVPQQAINQLLLEQARLGKQVVRLKGGDPFIFGRGGEELETLAEAGIPFSVVPGITAASGCAAYSGIPLTHRDHAQRVQFITGHDKEGNIAQEWSALAAPRQTLVFYMGLAHAARIQDALQTHGMPGHTPVALVEQGTQLSQRVVRGELQQLAELTRQVKSPSLIIIGTVVTLADKLDWYGEANAIHGI
ncbi:siroheme synthase CysG [Aeromonas veronii]|uniref:siroheme synthase CysG n=1 Tax=Aeromonas veronii TaxID=654 RepID=UPI002936E386|nr:siroheme synthase CysG [Aeromonas veronii]WOE83246.1 siroheme synthase CysG [Aeromonas veronii]